MSAQPKKETACNSCLRPGKYRCSYCTCLTCNKHVLYHYSKNICTRCWNTLYLECHTCEAKIRVNECVIDKYKGNFCTSCWDSLVANLERMRGYEKTFLSMPDKEPNRKIEHKYQLFR